MSTEQIFINSLFGLFCIVLGFVLNIVWSSVRDLQKEDSAMSARIGNVEKLVAGDYIKRSEVSEIKKEILEHLDGKFKDFDEKIKDLKFAISGN